MFRTTLSAVALILAFPVFAQAAPSGARVEVTGMQLYLARARR